MLWARIILVAAGICVLGEKTLHGLSLAEAFDKAVKSNNSVAIAENRVKESEERISAARSRNFPTLDLSGTYTYVSRLSEINIDIPLPIEMPEITTGTHNMVDTKVSGGYLLFDWGKRRKLIAQAQIGRELSETVVAGTKQVIAYQVVRSYATAALIVEQRRLLQHYVEISQKHLDDARAKFDNGLVSQFDLLKSEMQLKVYHEQIAILDAELKIAVHTLCEIMGEDSLAVEVTETLSDLELSEPSLDDDRLREQIDAKPAIISNRKQQQISNLSLGLEKLRPTVSLFSSAGWKNSYLPDPDKLMFNYAGGVAINYHIYDGGYARSRRAEEIAKQRSLELEIERLAEEARTAVRIFQAEVAKLTAKSRITLEKLALARKAMEIASVSYGSGMITNTEYLDTELQVQQIETEALKDRYDLLMAQVEIKKAVAYWPEIN